MAEYYKNGNIKWTTVPKQWISPSAANEILDEQNITQAKLATGFMGPSIMAEYDKTVWYQSSGHIIDIYFILKKEKRDAKGRYLGCEYIPQRRYVRTTAPNTASSTSGGEVMKYWQRRFKEIYKLGFKEAFGYSTELENCIPKPLNETTRDKKVSSEVLYPFYKIDASSAYMYEASKTLPTMIGSKKIEGYAEPTPDYPFAFYPKEGTLAIFGEFSTNTAATASYTVMCQASPYSLKEICDELYEGKEKAKNSTEKQYFKDVGNFFVGMWHYKPRYSKYDKIPAGYKVGDPVAPTDPRYDPTCPRYAALAAVVKARCNNRMLELRDIIEENPGNEVWLINTDAVGWVGQDMPHLYTNTKQLGNLILEHKNAEAIVLGSKKYQIRDEKGTETKWAGVPIENTQDMVFGDIRYSNEKTCEVDFDTTTARFTMTPL